MHRPSVSTVIPTWNEGAIIEDALRRLAEQGPDEVIVADGGSTDGTAERARAAGARVVQAPRGRAPQMNAGAARASGEVLLFLHADVRLPPGGLQAVRAAMARGRRVGGFFRIRFDSSAPFLGAVALASNLRSALTRVPAGDRAIFVRADAFRALGGYRPWALLEDLDLSRRLRGLGPVARLPSRVTASARRFERRGPVRTVLLMAWLYLVWSLGASTRDLARHYPPVPSPGGRAPASRAE
ncbi:MAG: TIGR04283 family arsenosugar biosynthesis glycosyltransferase [Planctomycetes bacterium]|nr:TIGR04283 family arsenosugar biosynthesis glycosyltransferase [Planctomycetota bacterium]